MAKSPHVASPAARTRKRVLRLANRSNGSEARRSILEGPYEKRIDEETGSLAAPDHDRFFDLILTFQDTCQAIFDLTNGLRELRMITDLVRSHLIGRVVTSSSLAAASGLTYGTAMRTIDEMLNAASSSNGQKLRRIDRFRSTRRATCWRDGRHSPGLANTSSGRSSLQTRPARSRKENSSSKRTQRLSRRCQFSKRNCNSNAPCASSFTPTRLLRR